MLDWSKWTDVWPEVKQAARTTIGKDGKNINQRTGMCLETQKYPDTPNKSHLEGWPSAILEPGQEYYSHCVYKFAVEK